MKPFLDTGFFFTLLIETACTRTASQITRTFEEPLCVTHLQVFHVENRLQRESTSAAGVAVRAAAAGALHRLQRYMAEMVFQPLPVDYDAAIHLARSWQREMGAKTPPALSLLWPALAATSGATHFLSFDSRPRQLAKAVGLKLLPESL